MESLSVHRSCATGYLNSEVLLQGRGSRSRVLGVSANGYGFRVRCSAFIGKGMIGLGFQSRKWRLAENKTVEEGCLQALALQQQSVCQCESWTSWLSEEADWGDIFVQTVKSRPRRVDDSSGTRVAEVSSSGVELGAGGPITTVGDLLSRYNEEVVQPAVLKSLCNRSIANEAKEALFLLGGALLFLGVALTFNSNALAESAASQSTFTSVQNFQGSQTRDENVQNTHHSEAFHTEKEETGILEEPTVDSLPSEERASTQDRIGKSEGFSEEFWEGIDTPKGSVEEQLKSYLEKDPGNPTALEALLYTQLEKQDMQRSLKILEKLIVLDPDQLDLKFMKAYIHRNDGDLELAKRCFEEILTIRPLCSRALQGLVLVMDRTGEGSAALEMIKTALGNAIEKNLIVEARNLRLLMGQFLTQKGNLEEALHQYKIMVDEDPNDFRPYLCQGLVYSLLRKMDEAEKQFQKYRELCPKDFPDRSFLDEQMMKAKNKIRKMHELKKAAFENAPKGKRKLKTMKQPFVADNETK
eukprot:c23488_g1_i1 orf=182-1762(+)